MASPIRPHPPINNPEAEPIEEEADDNISSREWDYLSLNNLKWISSSSLRIPQGNPMPIYGSFALKGPPLHRDDMWLVIENFCRPDIVSGQCLHFFAVYDSHCGSHVSSLCRDRLHMIITELLLRIQVVLTVRGGQGRGNNAGSSTSARGTSRNGANEEFWDMQMRVAVSRSFMHMDQEALRLCSRVGASNIGPSQPAAIDFTGSPANVAILCSRHIVVANCGESRAVLCRAGRAIVLAHDHKSYIQDKLMVMTAGGSRFLQSGDGNIDVTRLIDYFPHKRTYASLPQIKITERHEDDEFLILASTALWHRVSDAFACSIVSCCLKSGILDAAPGAGTHKQGRSIYNEDSELYPPKLAASTLYQIAFGRERRDNATVLVVDLKNFTEKK